jgi:hypothetical protein
MPVHLLPEELGHSMAEQSSSQSKMSDNWLKTDGIWRKRVIVAENRG